MGKRLTDALVDAICAEVKLGMSIKDAEALVGIKPGTLDDAVSGENPTHPEWRVKKDHAKAHAIKHYMQELNRHADGNEGKGNNAGVKAVQSVLMALDHRFRKEYQESARAMAITVIVGHVDDPILVEAKVIPQGQLLPPGAKGE